MLTQEEFNQLLKTRPPTVETSDSGLGSPFLRLLATAGRDLLSQLMTEQNYSSGEIIFKEGDLGDSMFIIWSGRTAVVKGKFQTPTILGYRGAGEIIGEMALLENQPRSASIIALETVRALRIRRNDFEKLLSSNPTMGLSILGTLSARLRAADDARKISSRTETQLIQQVSNLQTEKQQLLALERLRQDTIDLIVHDLRHPISSMFGAIKILEMVLPEEVIEANQQLISIANLNCDHLQLMVDSLLDVARMEAGEIQLKLNTVDLPRIIEEAISRTTVLTEMEDISVDFTAPVEMPEIVADEEKISRVISNLLNNAIKYAPVGSQVSIVAEAKNGEVLISISDTGPGIAPEDRERIFERFAQLTGNRPRLSGFGLGLAFCQLAVENHGGKIWVEPGDNDVGSRFVFTLPLSAHHVKDQALSVVA